MFLKRHLRKKDGKKHTYYSLVETIRTSGGPRHRRVAYLGEMNSSSEMEWKKVVKVFNRDGTFRQLSLFASDCGEVPEGESIAFVDVSRVRWERPRNFGDVFVATHLWKILKLDEFFEQSFRDTERDVSWDKMVLISVTARLLSPGSELSVEQFFYPQSALDDLTGIAVGKVNTDRLYRLLDHVLPCKLDLEGHLKGKVGELFNERFDLVLYDLTSTYFEGVYDGNDTLLHGYSRDHRPDCKQLVIGLVVTKKGLPFGYKIFPGNQSDVKSLTEIIVQMESSYGKADRIWVIDRGIVSEENLKLLSEHKALYLVGTPRSMLKKYEQQLVDQRDWEEVQEGIQVKMISTPDSSKETFILCKSESRLKKEEAIHLRFERKIEESLERLKNEKSERKLFERLGRIKTQCSRVARCYRIKVISTKSGPKLSWIRDEASLQYAKASQGAYILRTNLVANDPKDLWSMYMQLNDAEAAFRNLKSDLKIRPVYHQKQDRIEAHILITFLAYVLWKTLDELAKQKNVGLTARMILKTLHGIKSGDILLPLTDGKTLRLRRVSIPDKKQQEILQKLGIQLPERLAPDTYDMAVSEMKM